jgi:hypothetical protein
MRVVVFGSVSWKIDGDVMRVLRNFWYRFGNFVRVVPANSVGFALNTESTSRYSSRSIMMFESILKAQRQLNVG